MNATTTASSVLDLDHFDGGFAKLVRRIENLRQYMDDCEVLLQVQADGIGAQDAWFALAAARSATELGTALEHADAVARRSL